MSKRLWQTHHSRDTNRCHSRETSGNVKEWRLGSTWMWLCSHFGGGSLGLCSAIYAQLMAACGTWKLIEIDYGSHTLPLPFSCCNRTKQMPELTWGQLRNCIRDKQRSESHLYLFDYYLYAPSPGRNVKCRHSPMYVWCVWVCVHVCVACANNKQSAMMMSLLRGCIWSAAGQKDIDCQDFATLSFRLRPTPVRRPLWCATWHCYMWPPLEVAASRPGRLAKTMPTTHSSYHRIYK